MEYNPIKQKFAEDFKPGEQIDEIFIVSEKNISHKQDGSPYIRVKFTDKTGNLGGVIWDNVDDLEKSFEKKDYVRIKGKTTEYKNKVQVTVIDIIKYPDSLISPEHFLPTSSRNLKDLAGRMNKVIETVTDKYLKLLLDAFWSDEEFVKAFNIAPAAKKMHHAYLGGLLEHSLSMALLANNVMKGHYRSVNKELLLTGCILHDIGKIREFEYEKIIDYSIEGRLLSHIIIGVQMLDEKIASIPDFPKETALLLRHMIVSHHGIREFGSPEPPKTLEATILHQLDDLDSRVIAIRTFMEDDKSDNPWTPYHNLLERHFFKGFNFSK